MLFTIFAFNSIIFLYVMFSVCQRSSDLMQSSSQSQVHTSIERSFETPLLPSQQKTKSKKYSPNISIPKATRKCTMPRFLNCQSLSSEKFFRSYFGGECTAESITRCVLGAACPAGRLPTTWPRSLPEA